MRHTPHLAPLLVLLCCASGCLAMDGHRCMFDNAATAAAGRGRPPSVSVVHQMPLVRRRPRSVYTAAGDEVDWVPLAIHLSVEDLKDPTKYCTAVGQKRPNFRGDTVVCRPWHVVTEAMRESLLQATLPAAVKLHTERLSVESWWGPLKVSIPPEGSECNLFTIPESHQTDGVPDASFLLYVSAGPGYSFSTVCTEAAYSERPTASVMNLNPMRIGTTRFHIRIAAHEIAHALGFVFSRMKRRDMIASENLRGKTGTTHVVKSAITKWLTRWYYNCSTAQGMELEDEVGNWSSSHWERRNAKDELMSAYLDETGGAYYTALTLAAFEDTGYYRANFSMAERMGWGRNAGCGFLEQKCVERNTTNYPNMFCAAPSRTLRCTSDRYALGSCPLVQYGEVLPLQYQYFTATNVAGPKDALTDYCPVITATTGTLCSDVDATRAPGSRGGPMSRCLDGSSITLSRPPANSLPIGDVCANVRCDYGVVRVQYYGDDTWHSCPAGGALQLAGSAFSGGSIVCPAYADVCPTMDMPGDDTGNIGDQNSLGTQSSKSGVVGDVSSCDLSYFPSALPALSVLVALVATGVTVF